MRVVYGNGARSVTGIWVLGGPTGSGMAASGGGGCDGILGGGLDGGMDGGCDGGA